MYMDNSTYMQGHDLNNSDIRDNRVSLSLCIESSGRAIQLMFSVQLFGTIQ